ncbi:MAG: hypothetical protein IKX19_02560 [Clostridia bacterium]|nr:hypothetical protein [Clostridia bacterium]
MKNTRCGNKRHAARMILTAMMLFSCARKPAAEPLVISVPADSGEVPLQTEETIERAEETLPFIAAQTAFYADRTIYSAAKGLLSYAPVETGEASPLCFDPLCAHDNAVECPARIGIESAILIKDGTVYYTARGVVDTMKIPYEWAYQLRSMEIATGKVSILLEQEDPIGNFWLLGNEIYLSVPASRETSADASGEHIHYIGYDIARLEKNGSLTVVLEDPDGTAPALIGSDNGAVYYTGMYGNTPIYAADYGFRKSVPAFETDPRSYNAEVFDDCLYYIRWTDRKIPDPSETVEGDFDEDVSVTGHGTYVLELVRKRFGENEAEILCDSVPLPGVDGPRYRQLFRIDREKNALYYVPLDFSYQGYVIWEFSAEEKALQAQTGDFHDKQILTKIYSKTGGRLVLLDLGTLEARDVLSDCGADIVDLYVGEEGRVWARFELYNVEEIKVKMAAGESHDSMLTCAYIGSEEILP